MSSSCVSVGIIEMAAGGGLKLQAGFGRIESTLDFGRWTLVHSLVGICLC